jgi:hypothetical protein
MMEKKDEEATYPEDVLLRVHLDGSVRSFGVAAGSIEYSSAGGERLGKGATESRGT